MTSVRRGQTLYEAVVAITIGALIFTLLASITVDTFKVFRRNQIRETAATKANVVLDALVRTIRQAQPSPTGGYPLVAASATSITFYASTGAPGVMEQVRFFLQGTLLRRGIIQPVGTPATYPAGNEVLTDVLPGIQNGAAALFDYFGNTYTGVEAPMNPVVISTIRLVRVTLIYDEVLNDITQPVTLRFQAHLRNLKDNY